MAKKKINKWLDSYEDGGDVDAFNKAEAERFQAEMTKRKVSSKDYDKKFSKWKAEDDLYKLGLNNLKGKSEDLGYPTASYKTAEDAYRNIAQAYKGSDDTFLGHDIPYAPTVKPYVSSLPSGDYNALWEYPKGQTGLVFSHPNITGAKKPYAFPVYPYPSNKPAAPSFNTVKAQATLSEEDTKPIPEPKRNIQLYNASEHLKSQGKPYGREYIEGKGWVELKKNGGWLDKYK
jgi:hypothetical protein